MLPLRPDDPGAEAGRRTLAALREDSRPMLLLWADQDPVLPPRAGEALASALGQPAPRLVPDAGHFLQEDQGALVGDEIARWLEGV
jgi:haloalkane dehalogenase